MKLRLALPLSLFCLIFTLPAVAGYPVEEDGPLLALTQQINTNTTTITAKATDMDLKLSQVEQLIQQNIQPDIETMRKIQVNQADVALLLDKLTTLQQRGVLLVSGTTTSSGTGSIPAAGYTWNTLTNTADGLGGGFANNYISPQFQMPFGTLGQPPSALFGIQGSAMSGLLSVASGYANQVLGIGNGGSGFGGGTGIASALASSVSSVFGGTGFNLNSQLTATSLSGPMMLADDAFVRPALGTNGSTDAAFAQLVNGGLGQVMQGTTNNAFTFLAANALSGASSTYSPSVGTFSSGTNLINSILTNGAADANPAAYANFNQLASLVAANPSQYLVGGSKLLLSNTDVSNFESATQNGTAPSVSLSNFSLADMAEKSHTLIAAYSPISWLPFRTVQSTSSLGVLAVGPSMGTASQMQSGFGAAGSRMSAMDLTKTTTQQYIVYSQQILQDTMKIETGLEDLSASLTTAQKNAIPQLAQMEEANQDEIKLLQDKLQSLTGEVEHLNQNIFSQLQNYDNIYSKAVQEASQRAPLIAQAISVQAQANGSSTTSTTYYDPLFGKRFVIIRLPGSNNPVLALR